MKKVGHYILPISKNNNSPTSKVLSALGAKYYTLFNVADPSIDIGEGITRLHNASIAKTHRICYSI